MCLRAMSFICPWRVNAKVITHKQYPVAISFAVGCVKTGALQNATPAQSAGEHQITWNRQGQHAWCTLSPFVWRIMLAMLGNKKWFQCIQGNSISRSQTKLQEDVYWENVMMREITLASKFS